MRLYGDGDDSFDLLAKEMDEKRNWGRMDEMTGRLSL
jgi:hypothetical protein